MNGDSAPQVFWVVLLKPFVAVALLFIATLLAAPIHRALRRRASGSKIVQVLTDPDARKNHPVLTTLLAISPFVVIFVIVLVMGFY